jgi:hypothetical protein
MMVLFLFEFSASVRFPPFPSLHMPWLQQCHRASLLPTCLAHHHDLDGFARLQSIRSVSWNQNQNGFTFLLSNGQSRFRFRFCLFSPRDRFRDNETSLQCARMFLHDTRNFSLKVSRLYLLLPFFFESDCWKLISIAFRAKTAKSFISICSHRWRWFRLLCTWMFFCTNPYRDAKHEARPFSAQHTCFEMTLLVCFEGLTAPVTVILSRRKTDPMPFLPIPLAECKRSFVLT